MRTIFPKSTGAQKLAWFPNLFWILNVFPIWSCTSGLKGMGEYTWSFPSNRIFQKYYFNFDLTYFCCRYPQNNTICWFSIFLLHLKLLKEITIILAILFMFKSRSYQWLRNTNQCIFVILRMKHLFQSILKNYFKKRFYFQHVPSDPHPVFFLFNS